MLKFHQFFFDIRFRFVPDSIFWDKMRTIGIVSFENGRLLWINEVPNAFTLEKFSQDPLVLWEIIDRVFPPFPIGSTFRRRI
jgi:hypothetical protein